ncbi:hypothetical protein BRD17_02455 [Halobacteriales archaeon SW_7_68_16]|nr:MAG: hypothetical protein BRD17_02455 [Halobacteriales archaeon SW_7_68_16]
MDVRSDDRAQALQVGAILLLGFLIVGLSLYQVTVIPDQNRGVEFNAYQETGSNLIDLRNDVTKVASEGSTTGTNVRTGAEYPSRSLFVNPGPPNGRLRTTEPRNVTLENVTTADGEAANTESFVENGISGRNHSTQDIHFAPNYNVLDAQPMVVTGQQAYRYTNGTDSPFIPLSGQTLLQGDRLNLLSIAGDLDARGTMSSVTTEPVSTSTRTVTVTGDGGDIGLRLGTPAGVDADTWVNNTGESLNTSNDRVLDVEPDGGRVRIELNGSRTYKLKLARVEIREQNDVSDVSNPEPAYVVSRVANGTPAAVNETIDLGVEVRDRYNNPLAGTDVQFTYPNASIENLTTDENGVATISYEPTDGGSKEFTAEIVDAVVAGGEPTTAFSLTVFESTTGGGGDGSGGGSGDGGDGGGGSGDDGSGGGGGDSDVGTGGEAEWSNDDTEETVSTSGGLWENVTDVNRLLVSNPTFSPTKASDGGRSSQERFYRLVYSITDGETSYYMLITDSSSGLSYDISDGSWSDTTVFLIKERPDGSVKNPSADLNETALNQWYDPSTSTSEPINVLEPEAYVSTSGKTFRELLTETKQFLRNDTTDVFIAESHGRSDLNATPVGQPLAYADEFDDSDGSTEVQENASIQPDSPSGDVGSFENLQQDNGNVATYEYAGQSMALGTAAYGVKNASDYTLELGLNLPGSTTPSDVTVRTVTANGTTLQSEEIDGTIPFNDAATEYARETGNVYVVFESSTNAKFNLDYFRIRAG